jgi:subtilisin family serine protease
MSSNVESFSAFALNYPTVKKTVNDLPFEPVATNLANALQSSTTAEVVVTADAPARGIPQVRQILDRIELIGNSLYTGRLTGMEVAVLSASGVVRVDLDTKIKLPLVSNSKSKNIQPNAQPSLLWDTVVAVPETDDRLVSSQQQLGVDGAGSVVAVVDSGIDSTAVGLVGQVISRVDFSESTSSCSDNGFLDPVGHGTHVASIVAGKQGSFSQRNVRGVAPGAKLIDVRAFNCASETSESGILSALNWILVNKERFSIDIVNLSFGSSGNLQTGQDSKSIAVNRLVAAGLFVAVAAGNDGDTPGSIGSPGVAEFATTVGAASVSQYGAYQAPYSSVGPTGDDRDGIDFLAPGSSIEAANTTAKSGATSVRSGTSMASPYVAGIAALVLQQRPTEHPSGNTCVIGDGCTVGVVPSSMTNRLQGRIKSSDWYSEGIDSLSGAGLVSASATILGEQPVAAVSLSGSLRDDAPNVVQIPPHSDFAMVSMYTPVSVRSDMFDSSTLNIQLVDRDFSLKQREMPCSLLSTNVCMFAASTFTPYLYSFLLRPSSVETVLQISSPKSLAYHMTIPGLDTAPSVISSVNISNVDLSNVSSGRITVSRVEASTDPTIFTVKSPSTISVAASLILPAGPPGTSVSLSVERSGTATFSEDRVVLSGNDGSLLAARVRLKSSGYGRILYPNAAGYEDRGSIGYYLMADDGTIFMNSRATGMANEIGFDSIGMIPLDSLNIQKVELAQSSPSELDVKAIAGNGSAFIGYQFPAGAGLLPGDTDLRENYFVYRKLDGSLIEVGPDISNLGTMRLNGSQYKINENGTEVAWSIKLPSGDMPVRLGWQGGTNFGTTKILATFPATTQLKLLGLRGSHIVVEVKIDELTPVQFRDYDSNGNFRIIDVNGLTYTDAAYGLSPDGSAFSILNGNSEVIECNDNGIRIPFSNDYARSVGWSNAGTIDAVADDCSWIILAWTSDRSLPRGLYGRRLLKLFANDRMVELDSGGSSLSWLVDASGKHFIRMSSDQLEPGDINGETDFFRGLSGLSSSTVLGPFAGSSPVVPPDSGGSSPVVPPDSGGSSPVVPPDSGGSSPVVPPENASGNPVAKPEPSFTIGKSKSGINLAKLAGLSVSPTSKVSIRINPKSSRICRAISTNLKGLKAGLCEMKIVVTPKRGKSVSKVFIISITK